ncbi:MAG TPA: hypothetical protein VKS81_04875, partial [Bacteroidota bacterium]|nr:hypothetical protein [Bacteroidota bacterium]
MKLKPQLFLGVLFLLLRVGGLAQTDSNAVPGKLPNGKTILPNGWMLSPAGKQVEVGTMPLNIAIDPKEKYAIVSNNGGGQQGLSVISLSSGEVIQKIPLERCWLGLKFYDGGKHFAVSGGTGNRIYLFGFNNGKATLNDSVVIGNAWAHEEDADTTWLSGIDIDDQTGMLYAAGKQNRTLFKIDLASKKIEKQVSLGSMLYTDLLSVDKKSVFVSLWGGSKVDVIDPKNLEIKTSIAIGDHPNEMVQSSDGRFLYVACANENIIDVIDLTSLKVVRTLSSAMYKNSPEGSTPNSITLSGDGHILYVADADNNCIAVMDLTKPDSAAAVGFIPTNWYPTCVRLINNGATIVYASGKGSSSHANPDGPVPGKHTAADQRTSSMLNGTIGIVSAPDAKQLAIYMRDVLENARYKGNATVSESDTSANPIPRWLGQSSPIKHIFYIIKENRTYDQVFGDIKGGKGDPKLTLFGEEVTPNLHALVKNFVLLDNFYADAEVSADGHSWSTGAYVTDYIEKTLPTYYGNHGGKYDFEAANPTSRPSVGYIWDDCTANRVTFRDYGEYVDVPPKVGDTVRAEMPSQEGLVAPLFRGWDLDYSDVDRVKEWDRELTEYEHNGNLPQLEVIDLPNDHTSGTSKGKLTPRAFVAQNDLAVGMFIERISKSKYWKESAIFIVEDDAQNGPDHIDAHRTEAMVISPYVKHHF